MSGGRVGRNRSTLFSHGLWPWSGGMPAVAGGSVAQTYAEGGMDGSTIDSDTLLADAVERRTASVDEPRR
jgi:hypothetical protein